jgi:acyl transferase domain-containing protein
VISPVRGDVAIIGMSCLYPGAGSVQQFWENILNKVDSISDAPDDWYPELFCDPASGADDRSYTKRGGFLKELAEFDPVEYGIMPNSIDGASPDHFLAIRVASEALEDAGYANPARMDPFRERTAVILGHGGYVNRGHSSVIQRWVAVDAAIQILKQLHPEHTDEELALIRKELRASLPPLNTDVLPGLVPNIVSGRIANRLNLMGPTFNVDGACASSFLALDIACRELLSGRCDMALAGGVHASNSSPILIIFSQMNGLSRKGQIRPFDSDADGTLLSEGAGCLVLKRREDAERDGDRVYAVIKGMGISSDGRAMGLLAPRLEGEELAIRRAYEASGVDPASVELIEGHGTATLVGDATELEVLNRIFGARSGPLPRCALGSVKSMIGHSIPASGMASIIKIALSLYHKVLPPTIHCEKPNAKLQSENGNLYINSETRAWIHPSRDTMRRAAVNAFGFGGVNSHAVLEEHTQEAPQTLLHRHWDSELFVLTAADSAGLIEETRTLAKFVKDFPAELSLKDLAWSLSAKPFAAGRLAIVATSRDDLAAKLEKSAQRLADPKVANIRQADGIYYFRRQLAAEGKLAFVFPGEGAQYTNMLGDLSLHFPEVREVFDLADRAYLGHPRGYFPSELLAPPPVSSSSKRLWSMDLGSEAVLFANCAMFELIENLGVQAGMMVGHSTGEHTALRFAGAVPSADESALMQSVRSVNSIFEDLKSDNQISERTLLAIGGADHRRLEALVAASQGRLYLAIDNCPNQVVLCGEPAAIDEVLQELSSTAAICQKLPFARGYHSPWFSRFSERLYGYYQGTRVDKPRVPLYSCATAELFPDDAGEIRKIAASGWSRTVRFREVVEKMYQDGARIFLEVGPRGNLKSFIDDILRGKPYLAVASNVQHRSGILQLHHMLAMLFAHGVPLRLEHLYQRRDPRPIELKPAGRPKTRIKLGIEPMRLPPGFTLPPRKQPPAAAVASPMAAGGATESLRPTNGHPMQANGHSSLSREGTRQPAVALAPTPGNARAAVLERHFATMQQFLEVQQQVMGGALASRSGAPAVFSASLPLSQPAPPATPPARQESAAAPAPEPERRPLPLISEVLELIPGVRARSIYRVAMEPIFEHHSFGRDISDEDPDLTGLAIVPLTVSVEILAEAAALLAPGKVVVEMRNMRSQRWVMLDPRPFPVLEMTAEQVEPGVVHVKMRDAIEGKAIRPTWMEATVVFSDAYPTPPPPLGLDLQAPQPSKWTEGTLYPWGMFHGPLLRGVIRVDRTGTNGSIGALEILRHDLLLSGKPDMRFVLDPVTLDAVGQMISFWSQEQVDPFCDTLPYRFDSVQYFAPMPAVGTRMEGRVIVREVGERDIHCDLEVLDPSGRVLYRVKDWTDRRFPQPPDLWRFRVSPRDTVISKPAPDLLGPQPGTFCVRLDRFPSGFLDASFGIWGKMLAGLMLSRSERALWQSLSPVGPQRSEWLFLRCAAKDAVRLLVAQSCGVSLCPADIGIRIDAQGLLQVSGGWVTRLGLTPIVAAAYSGEQAVAVASLNPSDRVGVAMEQIASTSGALAIAEEEQGLFANLPQEAWAEWHARVTCAKRALRDALPGGADTDVFRAAGIEPDSGKVEVEWPDRADRFAVHTSRRDDYIYATYAGPSRDTQ